MGPEAEVGGERAYRQADGFSEVNDRAVYLAFMVYGDSARDAQLGFPDKERCA
jgi:hypothetical protein